MVLEKILLLPSFYFLDKKAVEEAGWWEASSFSEDCQTSSDGFGLV